MAPLEFALLIASLPFLVVAALCFVAVSMMIARALWQFARGLADVIVHWGQY